jgi:hypothetical protein
MKFKGLDGRTYSKNIDTDKYKMRSKKNCLSIGQYKLGKLLKKMHPGCTILEEFPCYGAGRLKLDFFIPSLKLAYEFDGRQHSQYVPHFHGDRKGFANSQLRDADKEEWCQKNGITLWHVTSDDIDEYMRD